MLLENNFEWLSIPLFHFIPNLRDKIKKERERERKRERIDGFKKKERSRILG